MKKLSCMYLRTASVMRPEKKYPPISYRGHIVVTLILMLLTTMTAWAESLDDWGYQK